MEPLQQTADSALSKATDSPNGRHAEIVVREGPLRQSVLALTAGTNLEEHNSPPAASLYLMRGGLRITGQEPTEIGEGELHTLTHFRHGVEALQDSVFLLTTVTSVPGMDSHSEEPPR